MFIPLGDDVQKRNFPIVPATLILANVLVFAYQSRLFFEAGKDADAALGRANITVNKNAVPNDPRSPFVTSGLRIGSPAVTRRGFKEAECATLTGWMCDILEDIDNDNMVGSVKQQVVELCRRFPVYPKV